MNMFATECSNPAATKAEIGPTMARILSATVLPAKVSHTARQTSRLQPMPKTKLSIGVCDTFAVAVLTIT